MDRCPGVYKTKGCGARLLLRCAHAEPFWGCERWPDCRFTWNPPARSAHPQLELELGDALTFQV